jgi:hypothetical protein
VLILLNLFWSSCEMWPTMLVKFMLSFAKISDRVRRFCFKFFSLRSETGSVLIWFRILKRNRRSYSFSLFFASFHFKYFASFRFQPLLFASFRTELINITAALNFSCYNGKKCNWTFIVWQCRQKFLKIITA